MTGGGGEGNSTEAIVLASRFSTIVGGCLGDDAGDISGIDGLSLRSGVRTLTSNVEGNGRSKSSSGSLMGRGVVGSLSDEISSPKMSEIHYYNLISP